MSGERVAWAVYSGLFENLQRGSGAAPGIEASTTQSRRRQFALRSYNACTAAAEYCGEPARRHKNAYVVGHKTNNGETNNGETAKYFYRIKTTVPFCCTTIPFLSLPFTIQT